MVKVHKIRNSHKEMLLFIQLLPWSTIGSGGQLFDQLRSVPGRQEEATN